MKMMLLILCLFLPIPSFAGDEVTDESVPPPPPAEIEPNALGPNVREVGFVLGAAFDPMIHRHTYYNWTFMEKKHLDVLRAQVLNQDVWHQMESKAHFDNCDFIGSLDYIRELMNELNGWVEKAKVKKAQKDYQAMDDARVEAYKRMGRLLHGVQDFYAHSNYVEMLVEKIKRKELDANKFDSETLPMWYDYELTKKHIKELQTAGLVSGVVWWGNPKLCLPGSPSHSDLAKDKNKGKGAIKVSELGDRTLHQLALKLAEKASVEFIDFAWEVWPILMLGDRRDKFPLEVLVDRRNHE